MAAWALVGTVALMVTTLAGAFTPLEPVTVPPVPELPLGAPSVVPSEVSPETDLERIALPELRPGAGGDATVDATVASPAGIRTLWLDPLPEITTYNEVCTALTVVNDAGAVLDIRMPPSPDLNIQFKQAERVSDTHMRVSGTISAIGLSEPSPLSMGAPAPPLEFDESSWPAPPEHSYPAGQLRIEIDYQMIEVRQMARQEVALGPEFMMRINAAYRISSFSLPDRELGDSPVQFAVLMAIPAPGTHVVVPISAYIGAGSSDPTATCDFLVVGHGDANDIFATDSPDAFYALVEQATGYEAVPGR
jgi:hypothetical protein